MTKLLVSVRSAAEAIAALEGGADLIDVKEPHRGPLGAADPAVIEAVLEAIAGRCPASVALGELIERRRLNPTRVPNFAKFGLAGCTRLTDWRALWQDSIRDLQQGVAPVAVVYADWESAAAPSPGDVFAIARTAGCSAVLVDTCDKSAGSLLDHWSLAEVHDFVEKARDAGVLSVVAGGLSINVIEQVVALAPDYIGVRGAACRGGRAGKLDSLLVRQLAAIAHGETATTQGLEQRGITERIEAR